MTCLSRSRGDKAQEVDLHHIGYYQVKGLLVLRNPFIYVIEDPRTGLVCTLRVRGSACHHLVSGL